MESNNKTLRTEVFKEIEEERVRQDKKFGKQKF